jgi:hypothetical protein
MIAHLRITCATGISRLRGDPLLHPYRLPTTGSSLQIHPQLLPIFAFTYDMKYHSRIQNEMQGGWNEKEAAVRPLFHRVLKFDRPLAGGFFGLTAAAPLRVVDCPAGNDYKVSAAC